MIRFDYFTFKQLALDVKSKTEGNRIGNITVVNSRDFLISFTSFREEKLLVSLNHQNPFFSYVKVENSIPTIPGKNNDILRKELKDAFIANVEILNEDKILAFHLFKTNDLFEKEKKTLIFEMIPQRCNLVLLDGDEKVIFALNYAPLESVRPILKGLTYVLPAKKEGFKFIEEGTNLEEFKSLAQDYLIDSIHKRMLEKYDLLFKYIKSRNKSQKAKLKVIQNEIDLAKENLKYQEVGNMLLALANDKEELNNYIEENSVKLNPELNIGQNANAFFKKYKKAKRTIEMDTIELDKAKAEIMKLDSISAQVNFMDDEDLYELAMELMPNRFKAQPKKNSKSKISYILVNNTKIYFGKNAKQNNEITFKIAKPKHTYMHIKDYHGSHVLIANENPSKEELLVGAEMCLLLSNKEVGDIMYTPISLVKKGTYMGEALLKTYETITLTSVRDSTKKLLRNWKVS